VSWGELIAIDDIRGHLLQLGPVFDTVMSSDDDATIESKKKEGKKYSTNGGKKRLLLQYLSPVCARLFRTLSPKEGRKKGRPE